MQHQTRQRIPFPSGFEVFSLRQVALLPRLILIFFKSKYILSRIQCFPDKYLLSRRQKSFHGSAKTTILLPLIQFCQLQMRVFHAQKKLHYNFTIFAMFLHHFSTKELSRLLIISYVSLSTISDIKFGGCDLSSVQFNWGKRKIMAGMKTCALAQFLDLQTFLNDLSNANILFPFTIEFWRRVFQKGF